MPRDSLAVLGHMIGRSSPNSRTWRTSWSGRTCWRTMKAPPRSGAQPQETTDRCPPSATPAAFPTGRSFWFSCASWDSVSWKHLPPNRFDDWEDFGITAAGRSELLLIAVCRSMLAEMVNKKALMCFLVNHLNIFFFRKLFLL